MILLVEDEMIIAFDLKDQLDSVGFDVDGPYPTVKEALEAITANAPEGAVLDVQLTDGVVYPVADRLTEMGVPIVFHSGHANPDTLRSRYPGASICTKPCGVGEIEQKLRATMEKTD